MTTHVVHVRIELRDAESNRLVTYDSHAHYFEAEHADGGHPDYQAIDDAVSDAIARLDHRTANAK